MSVLNVETVGDHSAMSARRAGHRANSARHFNGLSDCGRSVQRRGKPIPPRVCPIIALVGRTWTGQTAACTRPCHAVRRAAEPPRAAAHTPALPPGDSAPGRRRDQSICDRSCDARLSARQRRAGNAQATASNPFLAISASSLSAAPCGNFSPRSHWLTSPVVTLK